MSTKMLTFISKYYSCVSFLLNVLNTAPATANYSTDTTLRNFDFNHCWSRCSNSLHMSTKLIFILKATMVYTSLNILFSTVINSNAYFISLLSRITKSASCWLQAVTIRIWFPRCLSLWWNFHLEVYIKHYIKQWVLQVMFTSACGFIVLVFTVSQQNCMQTET
jgi:hypothetical protein